MSFDSPYLTKQIIAYIGNKRKLLTLIYKALEESGIEIKPGIKFADLFCGSGVVSRFAKYLGFEVYCNDWEFYSKILSDGFIKAGKKDIETLFGGEAEYKALLDKINSLPAPELSEQYIAKYYAAHSDDLEKADNKTERLFYTRENALAIDKIRNYIDKAFPDENDLKRNILISNLIYECATHTNTSGVFKAFHKGFGGHGKDALSRILGKIELHENILIDSEYPVHVYNEDSNTLAERLPFMDIVYLDPPYNQHQYGSNYHMLNTIARWDKIPEPLELNKKGVLENKAGIRADWIKTRSPYCYKDSAEESFSDLIEKLNAGLILISYSSDGIIPFDRMKRICLSKGYVSIVTSDYITYRGGKQSNRRVNSDIEFILVIDTSRKSLPECGERIDRVLLEKKILMMMKRRYSESRLRENFDYSDENSAVISLNGKDIVFPCRDSFILFPPENLELLSNSEMERILSVLENTVCVTKEEELEELLERCRRHCVDEKKYAKSVPPTLKKFAQKKYRTEYYKMLEKVLALKNERADLFQLIEENIKKVREIAELRFNT